MKISELQYLRRNLLVFVLLVAGWIAGLHASGTTVVELLPDPDQTLRGEWNSGATAIQPLEAMEHQSVSFTFDKGSGSTAPAYYANGANIRLYANNTMTVVAEGQTIERIVLKVTSTTYCSDGLLSANYGLLECNTAALTYTWSSGGIESEEPLCFTVGSKQVRFTSATVTLAGEGAAVAPDAPTFSKRTGSEFSEDFYLRIFAGDDLTSIRYTLDGLEPSATAGTLYADSVLIEAGADATVKAIAVRDGLTSRVVTVSYTYVKKYPLTVTIPNRSGVSSVYISSGSTYETLTSTGTLLFKEGDEIYYNIYYNTGYKVADSSVPSSGYITMPAAPRELVAAAVFDPTSPADPSQPAGDARKYTLTVVANPTGAASVSGSGTYTAGERIYVNAYSQSGYVFREWIYKGEPLAGVSTQGFQYTMPAEDVVLTADYTYRPSNPGEPQQPALKHPLTVTASPAGAGSFSVSSTSVTFGESYTVYAYCNTGYKFRGWILNGEAQETGSDRFTGVMTERGAQLVGLFEFAPSAPADPNANHFNSVTGQMIIDHFQPGQLYSKAKELTGDLSTVGALLVKGVMNTNDCNNLRSFSNAATIDVSRTSGLEAIDSYTFSNIAASTIVLPSTLGKVGSGVFANCPNLTSVVCHATEPPVCDSRAFTQFENLSVCTLYVPAESLPLYTEAEGWKQFVILPITDDSHILEVNLPQQCADGRYKNNSIEIINQATGVRQRYVVTDRMLYTFNGLQKDEQYNVYLYSQTGLEIARIEGVMIPDSDISVTFDNLRELLTVGATVVTPDGADVTDKVTVEWLKPLADGTTVYLRQTRLLGEVPDGQSLICRITLGDELGTLYAAPDDVAYTVSPSENSCRIALGQLRTVEVTGKVVDGDGSPLGSASVSAFQTLNGKFPKSYVAKTDRAGRWTLTLLDAPETRITYAANECVNINDTIGGFATDVNSVDLGTVAMRSIVGARVTYGFTYREAGSETAAEGYDDWQNVVFSVFNITQNREQRDLSIQYPILAILDETIVPGDELRVTATSKNSAFAPIVREVKVDGSASAKATFDIVGRGAIAASFEMTDNPSVVGMLYSSGGELLRCVVYTEAKATFAGLADGDYTLVTMGESELMSSILRLSSYGEIGLTEGTDYVKNSVSVTTGKVTEVTNPEIPAFDESLFYYTGGNTSFTVNKTSITTGNFLTLASAIEFKGVYKEDIGNVTLVVDLPEACDIVEKSVIQGVNQIAYTWQDHRLTIPLGENYGSSTRFCVIPTAGGTFTANASVVFDYKGRTITQPIGTASSEIRAIAINVPSVVNQASLSVKGVATANSKVKVYLDGVLSGETNVNSKGDWKCELMLDPTKPFESYFVYAEIESKTGSTLTTETKKVVYDEECPVIKSVTMINQAHRTSGLSDEITVFDFTNGAAPDTYWYWPSYPKFTFMADINPGVNNEIQSVTIYALTEKKTWVAIPTTFDERSGCWIGAKDFSSGNLPVNVGIDYVYTTNGLSVDYMVNSIFASIDNVVVEELPWENYDIHESDNAIDFVYSGDSQQEMVLKRVENLDKGVCLDYTLNGVRQQTTIKFDGANSISDDAEMFEFSENDRLYMSFTNDINSSRCEIWLSKSLVDNMIATGGDTVSDDYDFLTILSDCSKGAAYASMSIVTESDVNSAIRKSPLDDALVNCPELEPIIDRMRRRADHSNRMNNDLNNFRRPLGMLGRGLNQCGAPGRAAGAAVNTGDRTLQFGQGAGNYINGLADRNDWAALEAAGCLPDSPSDPSFPNPNDNAGYVMDPSGYVYEAVPENRVEGVQASIYYKETVEDMYGDLHENVVLWDAEEYAQRNPLFTDEFGMYQWDVPQGLWQVKFEKDGYLTAYSEWLPVPPPQLDVNVAIVQNKQPEVTEARAYEQGVEVQFDKFMDLSTLTADNIFVTAGGEKLTGEIRFVDAMPASEFADPDDENALRHASRLRFVPDMPLSVTTGEVRLTVSRNVCSYAGIPMTRTFTQILDVEKEVQSIVADNVKVLYGGEKEITVFALPYDAAVGRTLRVANSSALIMTLDQSEVTLDDEGKAVVKVKGDLPGRAMLTFSIPDVTATGQCEVDVVTELITAEAPVASRASGTAVYRGTKVMLTTESKEAVIYFTTDGSCPCDENGTRRKYTVPIVIDNDTRILAMTSVGTSGDDVSETVEFNYTLKRSDIDFAPEAGWTWMSHNFETPVEARTLAADEAVERIMSQTREIVRDPQYGLIGTLSQLDATESYKVETSAQAARQRLSDVAWNPATPIALTAGWNWLGYPVGQTMSVNEAFAMTTPETDDVIVGQNGFAQFDGENWVGTLETLTPGAGYMYQSSSAKSIVYNTSIVSTAAARHAAGISARLPLAIDIHRYPSAMPLIATLRATDGSSLDNDDYLVAAFCGDECRGIGRVVSGLVMVNVYGNRGDRITLRVTDSEGATEYACNASYEMAETVVGSIFEPEIVTLDTTTALGTAAFGGEIKVAVVDGTLIFSGVDISSIELVEIYDTDGRKVLRETVVPESGLRISHLTGGVYIVTVDADGHHTYYKVALR